MILSDACLATLAVGWPLRKMPKPSNGGACAAGSVHAADSPNACPLTYDRARSSQQRGSHVEWILSAQKGSGSGSGSCQMPQSSGGWRSQASPQSSADDGAPC